jgi:hypothetical protein
MFITNFLFHREEARDGSEQIGSLNRLYEYQQAAARSARR